MYQAIELEQQKWRALLSYTQRSQRLLCRLSHEIKGEGIYAYVTLMKDAQSSTSDNVLLRELEVLVRAEMVPSQSPIRFSGPQDYQKLDRVKSCEGFSENSLQKILKT